MKISMPQHHLSSRPARPPSPSTLSNEPQSHSVHGPFGQRSSLPNSKAFTDSDLLSGHEEEYVRSVGALAVYLFANAIPCFRHQLGARAVIRTLPSTRRMSAIC